MASNTLRIEQKSLLDQGLGLDAHRIKASKKNQQNQPLALDGRYI